MIHFAKYVSQPHRLQSHILECTLSLHRILHASECKFFESWDHVAWPLQKGGVGHMLRPAEGGEHQTCQASTASGLCPLPSQNAWGREKRSTWCLLTIHLLAAVLDREKNGEEPSSYRTHTGKREKDREATNKPHQIKWPMCVNLVDKGTCRLLCLHFENFFNL